MLARQAAAASFTALLAALVSSTALAQAGEPPALDEPVRAIATVDWIDALNPAYVNLDQDRFLFGTRQGVKTWDYATRGLGELRFEPAAGIARIGLLDGGSMNWARLGGSGKQTVPGRPGLENAGTVFIGLQDVPRTGYLLWWNPDSRSVAAALRLPGEVKFGHHRLLAIGTDLVLLCRWKQDASVAQLLREGSTFRLQWAAAGDPAVRKALLEAGVVGPVQGFDSLPYAGDALRDAAVAFDTRFCGWDFVDPPPWLAPLLDRQTRAEPPLMKPYFLRNGSVLVPELKFFDTSGKHWIQAQSALIRPRGAREWTQLRSNRGSGNQEHRVGQDEPVLATSARGALLEFFDPSTLGWRRSAERLPGDATYVHAEPLRSGRVLVMLRETAPPLRGMLALMSPATGDARPGRFVDPRGDFFGEVLLPGHRLLLLGAGTPFNPSDAVERVDMARGLAGAVSPFPPVPPVPRIPVKPSGILLTDGSVLVYGGLPPGCWPGDFVFARGACADRSGLPSLRYDPKEDRWQALPQLRIPFSRGPHWQTGNSSASSQWPRADVALRRDGTLAWVEAADVPARDEADLRPRTSRLMTWSPASPDVPPRAVAPLRKARTGGTLLMLDDGRLAVAGGWAQLETVALEMDCRACPDEFVSIGPFRPARSTEVLDNSDPARPVWKVGPLANFAGGKAFRLPGGRIFKLSLAGSFDSDGYQAEVADAAFTAWTRLPPLPKIVLPQEPGQERATVLVVNVAVIGRRVLLLTNRDLTIVWDDTKLAWQVWKDWPGRRSDNSALSVHPGPADGQVFVRWRETFALLHLPND